MWLTAAIEKTDVLAEKGNPDFCISCGEFKSTLNPTRLKDHLLVCLPFLFSAEAAAVPNAALRQCIQRANAAQPSGMAQSTLTKDKSSVKRKLMRAFADELSQTEAKLTTMFAEMVVATNLPHSWVERSLLTFRSSEVLLRASSSIPASLEASRYQLSTPLLLGIYAAVATKVNSALGKQKWLTLTSDGWSRQQGS